MASSKFGRKLNPYRSLREPLGVKECGNLWSSPTILAASTRTSSCLSGSPPLARKRWLSPGPPGWPSRSRWTAKMSTGLWFRTWVAPSWRSWPSKLAATKWCPSTTLMSFAVIMSSGRQSQRGQSVIIRGSMPLITETRRGFESVPETEIQALSLTRPSLMPFVIASSPHSTSSCSRATCHFTRAHWVTGSSMSSRLTTTAVWSRPQAMPMPHTTSEAYLSSTTWSLCQSWPECHPVWPGTAAPEDDNGQV